MPDYIPSPDGDFDAWQVNFVTYASANAAALGLDPLVDIPPLTAAQGVWATDHPANTAAQAAAQAARQAKDAARGAFEGVIRPLVARLQASPDVDDMERQALGITVRDTIPTPVGAPKTRPVVSIDTSQRLQHTIGFADEATPTSKAKPAGVRGAQIWVKVGDPAPLDPSELTFLATDTRTPYLAAFEGADANNVAHYMLRWESTRGETGPWSETASATIGA
ncbi:MAG TPA: hypothetical protein ENH55_02050 [Aurantimonas coralicida]|uniref:Uncharacterized protein n=1 Tax=marine sediment metagenome TaxID=412755 RepID=A0A0F9TQ03_9ZZZZ|nr:hypothetical protein [Phycisphaerae bacterium]HDZ71583.1 hypothetical protein [Aurantimonas coralicida]